ncbi:MAG: hypothetical protein KVP17_001058 [Porospora cf. gigantea B]|uniref:uncharacterized protein n=1 Tax=Porospora cf. gigantea B TaxID=2853592 RepID=UPI0035718833|nr:MAG: hypothetical protein KVP17_001058 [Porospora cf. gigantea B]
MPTFLCLPGLRTNKEFMSYQLEAAGWDELCDLVAVNPFHRAVKPADKEVASRLTNPAVFQWFFFDEDRARESKSDISSLTFTGHEESVAWVVAELQKGDYDGIICFSQGSIIGAAIIYLQQQGRVPSVVKKAIFVSGLYAPWLYSGMQDATSFNVPSLHITSRADFVYRRSMNLYYRFEKALQIEHDRGHRFPRLSTLSEEDQRMLRDFVN